MLALISTFKYVLYTMGVSKESISKFLIGNRFAYYFSLPLLVISHRLLFFSTVVSHFTIAWHIAYYFSLPLLVISPRVSS